ncbi:pyridoxal phosphate-dependent decarboxylase family protein [Aromatoleum evansii]|uniref:pyridoxal phosphate-dependent decarboxylase family protein n=1 Tax=Aromatoleum evansii TaxID=59406 RepID=UPI00145DC855|nr:aspartate aminotransferase family protein [Aromatoleum evansii]NMG29202.1 aspartate aminotransferase family protein [Aromatoleum evansii]
MSDDGRAALERAYAHALGFDEARRSRSPNVLAGVEALRAALDGPTPEQGTSAAVVIDNLIRGAEPGVMGTTGGRFFGWVIGASHPAGVAADWLTSIWGQNGGSFYAAPANAVAEQVAARWLLDLLGLPPESSVGFTTGATMANFVCLAAARNKLLREAGWDVEADGLHGAPPLRVCIGDDAHATVFSALRYLGLGYRRVTRVATDAAGRMDASALSDALSGERGPLVVIAQAGQINTGAFDPFDEIAELTHECGGWVHVDGAFGLWARTCPERAALAAGAEKADSWATDGHKWLQTPYDCGYAIVRDAQAHREAMTVGASYLPTTGEDIRDPLHFAPELSRRARGFATWTMLRVLGREGIAAMVGRHCALARRMADRLAAESGIEVLNDVELNQFVVRFGAAAGSPEEGDALTKAVIARTQAAGVCYVGGGSWRERWVMRVSVISWPTTEADVDMSTDSIIAAWREVNERGVG